MTHDTKFYRYDAAQSPALSHTPSWSLFASFRCCLLKGQMTRRRFTDNFIVNYILWYMFKWADFTFCGQHRWYVDTCWYSISMHTINTTIGTTGITHSFHDVFMRLPFHFLLGSGAFRHSSGKFSRPSTRVCSGILENPMLSLVSADPMIFFCTSICVSRD